MALTNKNVPAETKPEVTGTAADETAQGLEPSFGLSAGTANELALRGHAVSPFTGALLVGTGANDVREVSVEEYKAVAKEAAKRAQARVNKGTSFPKSEAAKREQKD